MNRNILITGATIIAIVSIVMVFALPLLTNKDIGINAPADWLNHNSAGISIAYPVEFELKPSSSLVLSNKNNDMTAKVYLTLNPINQIEKYNNAIDFCNSVTQYYQELETNLPSIQNTSSSSAQQESTDRIKVQDLEVKQIHGKQVCRYKLQGLTEENSSQVYSFFVNAGENVGVLQAIITYGKSASKSDIDKMRQVVTTLQVNDAVQLPDLQFPAI